MKILCIIPPYIPSYFNAGHHLPLFSVGNFLRKNIKGKIICIDAAALNYTWKEICDLLIKKFDFICVLNDFDSIDGFERFVKYCKEFTFESKLITFGRLSNQIPLFFQKFSFDAIVSSGDYEIGVLSAINYIIGLSQSHNGIFIKNYDGYEKPKRSGDFLPSDKWVLPDINEIPYEAYDFLYKRDFNKFCGIPNRRELVIPIARGCPVGCNFCDVPIMQGKTERRISVDTTIDYIIDSFGKQPFEYYSFYCPTFKLNKKWVEDFCNRIIEKGIKFPWKCVTVGAALNENLINLMSKAGNIRISIGIETLDDVAKLGLPKVKQDVEYKLNLISNWCKSANIELNCFVIIGLPGDSYEGVKYTIDRVLGLEARLRPTIYTPYYLMKDSMTVNEINNFNRQFLIDCKDTKLKTKYYNLFFNNDKDFETKIMNKIPLRKNEKPISTKE